MEKVVCSRYSDYIIAMKLQVGQGYIGIVEADYAQGQLYSSRALAESVWSTGYKTNGWSWEFEGVNLNHLFARHPPQIQLVSTRKGRWFFDNGKVILTLIIHWSVPPLFYRGVLKPCNLERFAKNPYQKNTPPAARLAPAILRMQIQAFCQLS